MVYYIVSVGPSGQIVIEISPGEIGSESEQDSKVSLAYLGLGMCMMLRNVSCSSTMHTF